MSKLQIILHPEVMVGICAKSVSCSNLLNFLKEINDNIKGKLKGLVYIKIYEPDLYLFGDKIEQQTLLSFLRSSNQSSFVLVKKLCCDDSCFLLKGDSDLVPFFEGYGDSEPVKEYYINETARLALQPMLTGVLPSLLSVDDAYVLTKKKCDNPCNMSCKSNVELPNIYKRELSCLYEKIRYVAERSLNLWKNVSNLSPKNLKTIALLEAIKADGLAASEKEYTIHVEFCRDLDLKNDNLEEIAFSMYRAINYASSTDPNLPQHQFSIDWHQHSPNKLLDFNLYRVDVLPNNKKGRSNSGVKRLLLAEKANRKYFVAYTPDHNDPSEDKILLRLKKLSA